MLGIGVIGHGGVGKTVAAKYMLNRYSKKEYITDYYHLLYPFLECLTYMGVEDTSIAKRLETELLKHSSVLDLMRPLNRFIFNRDPYIIIVDGIHNNDLYKELKTKGFYFLRIDPGVTPPTDKVQGLSSMKATYSVVNDGPVSALYQQLEIVVHKFLIKHGCS